MRSDDDACGICVKQGVWFYNKLETAEKLPTTSQITPYHFVQAFQPYVDAGDEIIGIFLSSKLSGTFQSATIAAQILSNFDFSWPQIVSLLMSALAAGLTVGGKAIGKSFAVNSCTTIVHTVGKLIFRFNSLFHKNRKKK